MAQDADNIIVGSYGEVWIGALGAATAPVDVTTAMGTVDADWKEVGHISEDGITFSPSLETFAIMSLNTPYPVRRGVASRDFSLSFTMQEWNKQSFALAMGGGTFTEIGTSDIFRFTPTYTGAVEDERTMVVHWEDRDFAYRLIVPRGAITDLAEFTLRRNEAAGLAVTFGIITDGTAAPFTIITNNTVFDPAA